MYRHATEVDTVDEGTAFEFLKVIIRLAFHLSVQYLDTIKAHSGGFFDAGFYGELQVSFEPPEGICGDGYRIGPKCGFGFAG